MTISLVVLAWTTGVTIARAIRSPNDFSEAHWLLDYRFGFMKRAFIGSLSSGISTLVDGRMTPQVILILSGFAFGGLVVSFFFITYRLIRLYEISGGILLLALVFASSPFWVMNAHLFGYLDALLYVFAMLSIALVLADRPLLAAVVQVAAMLTHESYFFIGFPFVCLASFLGCRYSRDRRGLYRHLAAHSIPLFVLIGIVWFQSTMDQPLLRSTLAEYLASFGFVATRSIDVALLQTTGFPELLRQQSNAFGHRLLDPLIISSVGPALLAMFYFVHSSFRLQPFNLKSMLALGMCLSPLALNAIASDTTRISCYTMAGAYFVLWIFAEADRPGTVHRLFALLAIPALVLNIFGRLPLMDGEVERFSVLMRFVLYSPSISLACWTMFRNDDRGKRSRQSGCVDAMPCTMLETDR